MAIAKRNTQHEYITLAVTFAPKNRLNLTWSYRGFKLSGALTDRKSANDLLNAADCAPGPMLPGWINSVEAAAKLAVSQPDFLQRVQALRAARAGEFAAAKQAERDELAQLNAEIARLDAADRVATR